MYTQETIPGSSGKCDTRCQKGNFCFISSTQFLFSLFLLQVCNTFLIKREKNSIILIKQLFPKVPTMDVSCTAQLNTSIIKLMTEMQNFAILELKGTQIPSSSILHFTYKETEVPQKIQDRVNTRIFPQILCPHFRSLMVPKSPRVEHEQYLLSVFLH